MIDFICDVVQEDGTSEQHMLKPPSVARFHNRYSNQGKPLKRKSRSGPLRGPNMRLEWKIFVEQTLFYILSDPLLAVRSFTKRGQLYDSQTLWYCMLRMTRIAPSLVFHSLWVASASLFPPPKSQRQIIGKAVLVLEAERSGLFSYRTAPGEAQSMSPNPGHIGQLPIGSHQWRSRNQGV